jgi:hypothetical protein
MKAAHQPEHSDSLYSLFPFRYSLAFLGPGPQSLVPVECESAHIRPKFPPLRCAIP